MSSSPLPVLPPIIVCGVARSGTTFVRDLLDSHPDIAMADEFFLYKVESLHPLFGELHDAFGGRLTELEWQLRKRELMRWLWFSVSRGDKLRKEGTARRFGVKTPGAEHDADFYEDVFEVSKPLWVYVVREGSKVFRSRKNMSWSRKVPSISNQLDRYMSSLGAYDRLRAAHPERVTVFQVDRVSSDYEERLESVWKLFRFVGEPLTSEVERFVHAWQPVQTTAGIRRRKGEEGPLNELSSAELEVLRRDTGYREAMERFGYPTP